MAVYIAGTTPALSYARTSLIRSGIDITDGPRWNTNHLLLDVPSFRPGNSLNLDTLLTSFPREITVWGGNLHHPSLDGYRCIDLLQDECYLTENARITAQCTLQVIAPLLKMPWTDTRVLIIGYGRIGTFLASMLQDLGCHITVCTRKMQQIFDIQMLSSAQISKTLPDFDIIINTAPAMIFTETDLSGCSHTLKIDLASSKGIAGDDVLWARGLPGIHAPEQSGKLIADTFLRMLKEEKQ